MEGLWTAEFGSSKGIFGGGVAIFRDGKLMGGDGGYFYLGEYTVIENTLKAVIEVRPFVDNYKSVFGTINEKLTLELEGSLEDQDHATAQGYPRGMRDLAFGVKLTKRS